ncbi:sensor histidine kinase [Arsenicitalea aurantiaca]|uniref:sensor histidine kinase n=1 Tax=Arsenicitalea aurantiaca TaxID=1783274 RepID=UPI0013158B09|nr:sensor histidine kinase [Arsenicitalea aurantiaca]
MHEHIYKYDRYQDIDAHDFIPAVVEQVRLAYGSNAAIHYDIEHIPVDRDHATPLALLLSELTTNAFKYAFADGRPAVIDIQLSEQHDGRAHLIVRDNGTGMTEEESPKSMGMRLVKGIVAQMGGEYEFRNEDGLVFDAKVALSVAARTV